MGVTAGATGAGTAGVKALNRGAARTRANKKGRKHSSKQTLYFRRGGFCLRTFSVSRRLQQSMQIAKRAHPSSPTECCHCSSLSISFITSASDFPPCHPHQISLSGLPGDGRILSSLVPYSLPVGTPLLQLLLLE
jgi:hypothetical protein